MSELAVVPHRSFGETSSALVGSILIVDDEAEIRESLRTLLELEGYEVEVAGSADAWANVYLI
jgi:PleD family two-component response regulator